MGCLVSISQSEVGVMERWGVFQAELQPGLHCLTPVAESVVCRISTRLQTVDLAIETKSKENTFCNLKLSVHVKYREDSIRLAYYSILDSDKGKFLKTHVTNIVRAIIPTMTLEEIFTASSKLAETFRESLNRIVEPYGMEAVNVLILEIVPDAVVKHAMNAMNAAERDRITAISTAEAKKIAQIKQAEGEAEARHLAGQGVANARRAIAEGLADSMSQFTQNIDGSVSQQDIMQLILSSQYYDMMRDVGTKSNNNTVIYLPPNASEAQQMAAQHREAAATASTAVKVPLAATSSQQHVATIVTPPSALV